MIAAADEATTELEAVLEECAPSLDGRRGARADVVAAHFNAWTPAIERATGPLLTAHGEGFFSRLGGLGARRLAAGGSGGKAARAAESKAAGVEGTAPGASKIASNGAAKSGGPSSSSMSSTPSEPPEPPGVQMADLHALARWATHHTSLCCRVEAFLPPVPGAAASDGGQDDELEVARVAARGGAALLIRAVAALSDRLAYGEIGIIIGESDTLAVAQAGGPPAPRAAPQAGAAQTQTQAQSQTHPHPQAHGVRCAEDDDAAAGVKLPLDDVIHPMATILGVPDASVGAGAGGGLAIRMRMTTARVLARSRAAADAAGAASPLSSSLPSPMVTSPNLSTTSSPSRALGSVGGSIFASAARRGTGGGRSDRCAGRGGRRGGARARFLAAITPTTKKSGVVGNEAGETMEVARSSIKRDGFVEYSRAQRAFLTHAPGDMWEAIGHHVALAQACAPALEVLVAEAAIGTVIAAVRASTAEVDAFAAHARCEGVGVRGGAPAVVEAAAAAAAKAAMAQGGGDGGKGGEEGNAGKGTPAAETEAEAVGELEFLCALCNDCATHAERLEVGTSGRPNASVPRDA